MATPANSPWAPAMGVNETLPIPVARWRISWSSWRQARKPWLTDTGARG